MTNNGVTGYDFSGMDGRGFLWKKACQRGVFIGLDNGVKVLNDAVVVGDDVVDHHIQPVIPLIFLLHI